MYIHFLMPPLKDDDRSLIDVVERELLTLQSSFRTILRCIEEEKQIMQTEKDKLQADRTSFEQMQKRIEEVNSMRKHKVKLNIGGSTFETSVETLTCERGSMLEAMFSGRFKIEKEDDGSSFIDRDPTYFPLVLSYLREKREDTRPKKLNIGGDAVEKVCNRS